MDDAGYELPALLKGRLIKRYKRFLADIRLDSGDTVTAHCPNSGSMRGCAMPESPVWVSKSTNPRRKLAYTWELIDTGSSLVGIHTLVPNRLVKQAIDHHLIQELSPYTVVQPEITTRKGTRLDLLLADDQGRQCYVEIKNCTLVEDGLAMFPDAVTIRGQKHLDELARLTDAGHRGVIFYLIQRMDARRFAPAAAIDPAYARKLTQVRDRGVEILTRDVGIDLLPGGRARIRINQPIPVVL